MYLYYATKEGKKSVKVKAGALVIVLDNNMNEMEMQEAVVSYFIEETTGQLQQQLLKIFKYVQVSHEETVN